MIILPQKIEQKSILVGNHAAKVGPMAYEIALPVFSVKWGAHEMLGNYKSRRSYLKNIFYIKKKKMSKGRASFLATFEALFSKMVYKGMKLIGTYQDGRIRETLKNSIKVLEENNAVMIFPEDSSCGYYNVMKSFFSGFVMLSELYYKKYEEDLPVYPMYYNHRIKRLVVGFPLYVQELYKKGLSRKQVSECFCNEVNKLYYEYFEKDLMAKV